MQADSAQQQGLYRPEFDHDACGIGALADINGERHHQILDDALSILVNLEHRGGTGLEKNTGDGAGILFQVPHHFFRKEAQKCGQILPAEGDYGVAMLFFPQDDKGVEDARRVFEEGCAEAGVPLLFWREVPVDPHDLGETARACMPTILQAFLGRPDDTPAGDAFERRLYVCRRTIEKEGRCRVCPARQDLLRVLHELAHHRVQGHAGRHADAPLLHRPQRRRRQNGRGARPLALLHQHHAQLGACAPQPLYHP